MKKKMESGKTLLGTALIIIALIIAFAVGQTLNIQAAPVPTEAYYYESYPAYQIDEASATVTYIRYQGGSGRVYIKKISISGNITTQEKAKDYWDNRATASYSAIND